jgi:hypothetical protein
MTQNLQFTRGALGVILLTALIVGIALGAAYRSYAAERHEVESTFEMYKAFSM